MFYVHDKHQHYSIEKKSNIINKTFYNAPYKKNHQQTSFNAPYNSVHWTTDIINRLHWHNQMIQLTSNDSTDIKWFNWQSTEIITKLFYLQAGVDKSVHTQFLLNQSIVCQCNLFRVDASVPSLVNKIPHGFQAWTAAKVEIIILSGWRS